MRRRLLAGAALALLMLPLAGCGGADPDPAADRSTPASRPATPSPSGTSGTTADPSPTPSRTPGADRSHHLAWRALHLAPGWGPGWRDLDRATRLAQAMSTADLAGQTIIVRYTGTSAPVDLVEGLHLGGVIVFDDNVTSGPAIAASNRLLQTGVDRPWPVWIGVDQEGGVVSRLSDGVTAWPNMAALGAVDDPDLTTDVGRVLAADLARLGFTSDFAPDADVTTAADVTIRARSFGTDADVVAEQAGALTSALWQGGEIPVVKHFPGHGAAGSDSHLGLPTVATPLASLRAEAMRPFERLVDDHAPAVMVGHLRVPALDDALPASLSKPVITDELRGRLGFDGLVVTDALDMGAIVDSPLPSPPAVLALEAGADLLLMPPDPTAARDQIVAAVADGDLSRERLEQAAARQIALLLNRRRVAPDTSQPSPDGGAVATELARRSVRVVSGRPVTGDAFVVRGPDSAVEEFRAAGERAGVRIDTEQPPGMTLPEVALLGSSDEPGDPPGEPTPDVLVSLYDERLLEGSRAPLRVIAYGQTPATMDAVLARMRGLDPPG